MRTTLSQEQARGVALAAQGFGRAVPPRRAARVVAATIGRLRLVQLDSVNVFARAHYLPSFSRAGSYDTEAFDELVFSSAGDYTEVWAHAASVVPTVDWPLYQPRRDAYRAKYGPESGGWASRHPEVIERVRAELADRGPLRPAELDDPASGVRRGPWWDWSDVKHALEHLFHLGEVAIAGRRGFERRYALSEQLIPASILQQRTPREDAIRELVRRAAVAYGVATAADLDDYFRIGDRRATAAAIQQLVDAGELIPVQVEGWQRGEEPLPAWLHREARVPRRLETAAILSPFDPVVWFRDRALRLFGFDYRIEIYTPPARRRYGYYSLPVLLDGGIVGRVDLKADRGGSRLLVQSAWWEPGAPPDAVERVATLLRSAADWQQLAQLSISSWGDATQELRQALPTAERHETSAPS